MAQIESVTVFLLHYWRDLIFEVVCWAVVIYLVVLYFRQETEKERERQARREEIRRLRARGHRFWGLGGGLTN